MLTRLQTALVEEGAVRAGGVIEECLAGDSLELDHGVKSRRGGMLQHNVCNDKQAAVSTALITTSAPTSVAHVKSNILMDPMCMPVITDAKHHRTIFRRASHCVVVLPGKIPRVDHGAVPENL